ncbi:MAG: 5-amino-6-(5-phospho-D-ribitylamino)uracil phosphatase YigB [Gammaproteobacteria bacterium]|nr:5-amino-6-(5-phospho-D-ribitylamino)uracil phosphatase YigB [Gammaproteobacteria bacterium]
MIRAITFDLWDTVIHDNSDEPKRAAVGLRSKRDERRHLLCEALNADEPVDRQAVNLAYDVADAAFHKIWHNQFVTWTIRERLEVALEGLGRELSAAAMDRVAVLHEEMEVEVPPDPIEGVRDALRALSADYPLAVVSDAIVSPARCLRRWLEMNELAQYFSGFAFSDEVGRSKPHRDIFASAARQMGVEIDEMVHIGDRDHNDVKGPHALGMKAVLFVGTRDHDRHHTTADAICEHHRELPGIIAQLAVVDRAMRQP